MSHTNPPCSQFARPFSARAFAARPTQDAGGRKKRQRWRRSHGGLSSVLRSLGGRGGAGYSIKVCARFRESLLLISVHLLRHINKTSSLQNVFPNISQNKVRISPEALSFGGSARSLFSATNEVSMSRIRDRKRPETQLHSSSNRQDSLPTSAVVQGSAKGWSLGCVIPASRPPLAAGGAFHAT